MTSYKTPPSMSWAVHEALKSAKLKPEDRGAVALARLYAVRLDECAELAAEARLVAELLDPDDAAGRKRLAALSRRVQAVTAAAELGPKLEAVLTALGMTLRGRTPRTTGRGGETDVPSPGGSKLDELKARRAARQTGA